jgi:hypothetical protein
MSKESNFWKWFKQNEQQLLHFEDDRERTFDEVAKQLQKVDRDLCFEFGPPGVQRELIISAGGIKTAFPSVVALTKTAPPDLRQWRIIAFRPRRHPIHSIEFNGVNIGPEDVQFSLLDNGVMAGLYLFIPGFRDGNSNLGQIGYLMLDEALGELNVETKLGLIKMLAPETSTNGDRYPFTELPLLFDQLTARLEGRSGIPS